MWLKKKNPSQQRTVSGHQSARRNTRRKEWKGQDFYADADNIIRKTLVVISQVFSKLKHTEVHSEGGGNIKEKHKEYACLDITSQIGSTLFDWCSPLMAHKIVLSHLHHCMPTQHTDHDVCTLILVCRDYPNFSLQFCMFYLSSCIVSMFSNIYCPLF